MHASGCMSQDACGLYRHDIACVIINTITNDDIMHARVEYTASNSWIQVIGGI